MAHSALSGIRVLDLSVGVAGPVAAKLFAVYGADVVKVERPAGDPARGWGPFLGHRPGPERGLAFLDANAGKRGIRLDLADPRGRAVAVRLVRRSDLVVESFAPGTLARLGLGPEVFADTVLLSVSNFGQDGPYRDVPASEIVLYAMGHEMYGTGAPDREPLSVAPLLNLYFAGLTAAVPALGAVLGRRRQHTGAEHVDVSIMEALLASIDRRADSLVAYAYCGEPMRRERAAPGPVPVYSPCRDGHVAVSVSPAQWPRLLAALRAPRLSGAWPTEPEAVERFRTVWRSWCAGRDRAEVTDVMARHGIPCAPVNSLADVHADPHLAERGFFADLDRGTRLRHAGPAIRLARTPGGIGRPAPRLGEHTDEVLGEIGYSAADVADLRTAGVV